MSKSFFKTFIHDLGDPDTTVASDGLSSSEFTGYIDTGSYILNAAVSGSLYGGIPNNKAVVFAGDPATGKTFFALGIIKSFLTDNQDGHVFYFDTESAVTNEMLTTRGIDITRIAKSEPDSIEKFRHVAYKTLDAYMQLPEEKRFPLLMVLDSLSALPSKKETEDMANEKDVRDMSKATLIKAAFRVLRLKLAKAKVPLIVTNHVYSVIGSYFPTKEMAGGQGAKYAADIIVFLSKKKDRAADKEVVGNIVKARMMKSRLTKEETAVETRILFDGGLDRHYGLLAMAVKQGCVKKVSTRYEFPNGAKVFEKAILRNPEKYFTTDILDNVEVYIKEHFLYGSIGAPITDEELELDDE